GGRRSRRAQAGGRDSAYPRLYGATNQRQRRSARDGQAGGATCRSVIDRRRNAQGQRPQPRQRVEASASGFESAFHVRLSGRSFSGPTAHHSRRATAAKTVLRPQAGAENSRSVGQPAVVAAQVFLPVPGDWPFCKSEENMLAGVGLAILP